MPTPTPDIASPEAYADGLPFAAYAELRARPGLAWHEYGDSGFWAVTRHADVDAVSREVQQLRRLRLRGESRRPGRRPSSELHVRNDGLGAIGVGVRFSPGIEIPARERDDASGDGDGGELGRELDRDSHDSPIAFEQFRPLDSRPG